MPTLPGGGGAPGGPRTSNSPRNNQEMWLNVQRTYRTAAVKPSSVQPTETSHVSGSPGDTLPAHA